MTSPSPQRSANRRTLAVVFDMDGVLVDSEPSWKQAEIEVLGALGVPIDWAATDNTKGMRIDEAIAWWYDRHPWTGPSVPAVAERVVERVAAAIRAGAVALPGALEAIAVVVDASVPHAIATSSPWPIIDAVIDRLGLSIPIVCSAEDEAHGKPHPAVYLRAAQRIGVDPAHCLAVEDSRTGARSALAAGMTVVAVQPIGEADFRVAGVDLPAFLRSRLRTVDSAATEPGALSEPGDSR